MGGVSFGKSLGKPCESDVRMENYFENRSTGNDVRVGGDLAKVGGA